MNLYHGSGFNQDELMSGFKRTGELVKWDKTETNEWLYAAVSREEAITMGFSSILEKTFNVSNYKSSGNTIVITIGSGRLPTLRDLQSMAINLYTIEMHERTNWVLVNNSTNDIKEEYKTKETLDDCIINKEVVECREWLSGKDITIIDKNVTSNNW